MGIHRCYGPNSVVQLTPPYRVWHQLTGIEGACSTGCWCKRTKCLSSGAASMICSSKFLNFHANPLDYRAVTSPIQVLSRFGYTGSAGDQAVEALLMGQRTCRAKDRSGTFAQDSWFVYFLLYLEQYRPGECYVEWYLLAYIHLNQHWTLNYIPAYHMQEFCTACVHSQELWKALSAGPHFFCTKLYHTSCTYTLCQVFHEDDYWLSSVAISLVVGLLSETLHIWKILYSCTNCMAEVGM